MARVRSREREGVLPHERFAKIQRRVDEGEVRFQHGEVLEIVDLLCDDAANAVNVYREAPNRALMQLYDRILWLFEHDSSYGELTIADVPSLEKRRRQNQDRQAQREYTALRYTRDVVASVLGHIAAMETMGSIATLMSSSSERVMGKIWDSGVIQTVRGPEAKGIIKFGNGREYCGDEACLMVAMQTLIKDTTNRSIHKIPQGLRVAFNEWTAAFLAAAETEKARLCERGGLDVDSARYGDRLKQLDIFIERTARTWDAFLGMANPASSAEHSALASADFYRSVHARRETEGPRSLNELFDDFIIGLRHVSVLAAPSLMRNPANAVAEMAMRYAPEKPRSSMFAMEGPMDPFETDVIANLTVAPTMPARRRGFCAGSRPVKPVGDDAVIALKVWLIINGLTGRNDFLAVADCPFERPADNKPVRMSFTAAETFNLTALCVAMRLQEAGVIELTEAEHRLWTNKVPHYDKKGVFVDLPELPPGREFVPGLCPMGFSD